MAIGRHSIKSVQIGPKAVGSRILSPKVYSKPQPVWQALALLGVGLVAACSPVGAVVGVGAKGAVMASEERGFNTALSDTGIAFALEKALFEEHENLFRRVGVTVREGQVLLSGTVPEPEDSVRASRVAWTVSGVVAVINQLDVTDQTDLVDRGRDLLLEQRMEGILLLDKEIASINYTVDVVNGTLYLMGIAQSEQERERVKQHARGLEHLRRIADLTRLRSDVSPLERGQPVGG